ncbi:S-adenosyl-L-methionine-dependent methyltransferase [Auriscalpium vulgare]|uniref:S-adenosyl-L-methionine-dependent methyltransferase n=1 Tax=Auriscalpium vulgare TaxID=40419 RepID=A0ACB8RLT4_9AGAM|nr:S-adenosyl-L-methionine-dependent methyltransferase [Auriscalpium vulgare]
MSSQTTTVDARRPSRTARENQFVSKYGRKHHDYKPEKAPYPMSYDKDIMDRDAIHHHMWKSLMDRPTMMTTPSYPPERVLDLGCGAGMWTIDAARAWPETEFVGYDLVNVQIPLEYLEPSVSRRITWEHGNFISTKLPFDDETFDHVHIVKIARGVPEHKWSSLFEEIHRVLQPDGFIEVIEEDIIFPVLPRWFTEPLHVKTPSTTTPAKPTNGASGAPPPSPPPPIPVNMGSHDHAFLELLFESIFESRFINMKPTAVVLGYFTPYFSRCVSAPRLSFAMPYLAPLPPLPEATRPSTHYFGDTDTSFANIPDVPSYPNTRPSSTYINPSASDSESDSSLPFDSLTDGGDGVFSSYLLAESDDSSSSDTRTLASATTSTSESSSSPKRTRAANASTLGLPAASWAVPQEESTLMDSAYSAQSFIPVKAIERMGDRTRAMNLYHAFLGVLGCKEAMWEELKLLQRSKRALVHLAEVGWDTSPTLEDTEARARFEEAFDRFQSDIYARISLWYSLSELGYSLPKREPLLKSELLEEERRRKAILDARASAPDDDFNVPSRVMRVFIGFKESEGDDFSDETVSDEH